MASTLRKGKSTIRKRKPLVTASPENLDPEFKRKMDRQETLIMELSKGNVDLEQDIRRDVLKMIVDHKGPDEIIRWLETQVRKQKIPDFAKTKLAAVSALRIDFKENRSELLEQIDLIEDHYPEEVNAVLKEYLKDRKTRKVNAVKSLELYLQRKSFEIRTFAELKRQLDHRELAEIIERYNAILKSEGLTVAHRYLTKIFEGIIRRGLKGSVPMPPKRGAI